MGPRGCLRRIGELRGRGLTIFFGAEMSTKVCYVTIKSRCVICASSTCHCEKNRPRSLHDNLSRRPKQHVALIIAYVFLTE